MVRELEYLDQALVEAEAAVRWYADRSPSAAARFSELDEAEAAILGVLTHGYRVMRAHVATSFDGFLSVWCTGSRTSGSSFLRSHMRASSWVLEGVSVTACVTSAAAADERRGTSRAIR